MARSSPVSLSTGEFRRDLLRSGMVVLTERMTHVRSVALGVWVKVGSRDERGEKAGISHLMEHMLFQGTARRSAEQIAAEIDGVGGTLDAFTNRESTCFYAKVLGEHLPLAVDLLTDILRRSRLDAADLKKEQQVVLQEIKMVEDTPDDLVHDLFAQTIWGSHPLARSILGTPETVCAASPADLRDHMAHFYQPDQMIVAAAGDLEHARLVALLEEGFDGFAGKGTTGDRTSPVAAPGTKGEDRDLSQVHICVGVEALPYAHEERYTLALLNTILGGGTSSRLFQEVREKRGLVYSIYSYHTAYRDCGLLVIYAGTNPDAYGEVVDLIQAECRRLAREPINREDLTRAQEQLKGNLLLGLESTNSRMSRLATMEIYFGRTFDLDEVIRGIEEVTPERFRALARDLFDSSTLTVASVGRVPVSSAYGGTPR